MSKEGKYIIHASIRTDGTVARKDVIGAIFGQTEGLLGDQLQLRKLQRTGRIGHVDERYCPEISCGRWDDAAKNVRACDVVGFGSEQQFSKHLFNGCNKPTWAIKWDAKPSFPFEGYIEIPSIHFHASILSNCFDGNNLNLFEIIQ